MYKKINIEIVFIKTRYPIQIRQANSKVLRDTSNKYIQRKVFVKILGILFTTQGIS